MPQLGYDIIRHDCQLTHPQLKGYLASCNRDQNYLHGDKASGWFMVAVRSGLCKPPEDWQGHVDKDGKVFREDLVAHTLAGFDLETWSPHSTEEQTKGRKTKKPGKPNRPKTFEKKILVLPGFILVKLVPSAAAWHALNSFKDIHHIHANAEQWGTEHLPRSHNLESALRPRVIERIRELETSIHKPEELRHKLVMGMRVRINTGAFEGHEALVEHVNEAAWIVCIHLNILGAGRRATLAIDEVDAIEEKKAA